MLISGLHSLTGKNIGIPYKFKEGGLISTISCEDAICGVDRDSTTEEGNISFFLEVVPLLDKDQQ